MLLPRRPPSTCDSLGSRECFSGYHPVVPTALPSPSYKTVMALSPDSMDALSASGHHGLWVRCAHERLEDPMARKILVGLVAVVAVGALAAVVLHSELADPDIVYVQIDNDSVHSIEPHGGMCYSYQLEGATPDGQTLPITLDTERIFRDTAYLRLKTRPLVGVVSWEEVQWDEIPAAAQAKLPAPEAAQ